MFWLVGSVGRALDGSFVSGLAWFVFFFGSGPDPGSDRPRRSELFVFSPFFDGFRQRSSHWPIMCSRWKESHASRCYGTWRHALFTPLPLEKKSIAHVRFSLPVGPVMVSNHDVQAKVSRLRPIDRVHPLVCIRLPQDIRTHTHTDV